MKILITNNTDYETHKAILHSEKWEETLTFDGDRYILPIQGIKIDTPCIISCDTEEEIVRDWYQDIHRVETGNNQLVFYSFTEPMVDIPIKIIKLDKKER